MVRDVWGHYEMSAVAGSPPSLNQVALPPQLTQLLDVAHGGSDDLGMTLHVLCNGTIHGVTSDGRVYSALIMCELRRVTLRYKAVAVDAMRIKAISYRVKTRPARRAYNMWML